MLTFNKTSSDLGNTLVVLRNKLKDLKRDMRADRIGKKEFEDQLGLLQRQKSQIQRNRMANVAWAEDFDKAIGPFEKKYSGLTTEITQLYKNAKHEHSMGLKLLMEEFSYHPVFKRWNDGFSATPFRPK